MGKGNSDMGKGNSDMGKGNSDMGKGNSDMGKGNSDMDIDLEKINKIYHDLSDLYKISTESGSQNRKYILLLERALSKIYNIRQYLEIQINKDIIKRKIDDQKGRRYGDEEIIRIEDTKR